MSLQGLPETTSVPGASLEFNQFVFTVREFMRDYPELNRLVTGQETSNRQIAWAAIDAIEHFNATPPDIGMMTYTDMLQRGLSSLLRRGTIINLLYGIGLLQTRNHLPFSDGGLNVAVSDKTPLIQSWIQMLQRSWELGVKEKKTALNIESLFSGGGGTHTEYFVLSGYYPIDLITSG